EPRAREQLADPEVAGQTLGAKQRLAHATPSFASTFGTSGCSCRKQRTSSPSTSSRRGRSALQRENTCGQRGAKRQPAGGRSRSGGEPGIPSSCSFWPWIDGNASSSPSV